MSESLDPDNPVVLFGDVGPEVLRLGQIYNPLNDQYRLSQDEVADLTKTYYTRSYANKTITFTPVGGVVASANPEALGWYEVNPGHEDQKGKYVPSRQALVVVEKDTEDYAERTVLIVKDVDDQTYVKDGVRHIPTFKSTLVPLNYGAASSTARALNLGNGDYMLYYDKLNDGQNNIRLMPDRKLMLYGRRYYMYRIMRGTEVISAPTPELAKVSANALTPFISASAERVTLTPDNYGEYVGHQFDTVTGSSFKRITVPAKPEPGDTPAYVPSFDAVYRSAGYYYHKTIVDETPTYALMVSIAQDTIPVGAWMYKIDDELGHIRVMKAGGLTWINTYRYFRKDGTNYVYVPITSQDDYQTKRSTFGTLYAAVVRTVDSGEIDKEDPANICETAEHAFERGVTGYIDMDDSKSHVYYADASYLKSTSIVAGEILQMEVFELWESSMRLVLSCAITAREGAALDATQAHSKRIVDFDVELDNASSEADVWLADIGESVSTWVRYMKPFVTYDDGSKEYIALDNESCFLYGLEAVNTTIAEREFDVLFKYYPEVHKVKQMLTSLAVRGFCTKRKRIRIINESTGTVRKISMIPLWDHDSSSYLFRYLIYRNDWASPEILDNVGNAVVAGDMILRSGSPYQLTTDTTFKNTKVYYKVNVLTKNYDVMTKGTVVQYNAGIVDYYVGLNVPENTVYEFVGDKIVDLKGTEYMDAVGNIRPTSRPGSTLGYIQHSVMAVTARAEGHSSTVYSQPIAFRLQNLEFMSVPAKWIIGDDTTAYDAANMKYGNPDFETRPYIRYQPFAINADGSTNHSSPSETPFKIGDQFGSDTTRFLRAFYYLANPPTSNGSSVDTAAHVTSDEPVAAVPTYFMARALTRRDVYERLDSTAAIEDVIYYNESGRRVYVNVGDDVSNYNVKVQADLIYYQFIGGAYMVITDMPAVGTIMDAELRARAFVLHNREVNSGYVSMDEWSSRPFDLEGALRTTTRSTGGIYSGNLGGAIPTVTGDTNNTMVMGTVIVEFSTFVEGSRKHLYGVPVEIRFPYVLTDDEIYQENKQYYVYNRTDNCFDLDTAAVVGQTIPRTNARWEAEAGTENTAITD